MSNTWNSAGRSPNTSLIPRPGSTPADGTTNTSGRSAESIALSLSPSVIDWTPGEIIEDCGRDRVVAALKAAEDAIRPAGPLVLGAALSRLLSIYPRPREYDADRAMAGYLDALADLPADLVAAACEMTARTRRAWPTPADIREPVERELAERRRLANRLRLVVEQARFAPTTAEGPLATAAQFRALIDSFVARTGVSARRAYTPRSAQVDMTEDERERAFANLRAGRLR